LMSNELIQSIVNWMNNSPSTNVFCIRFSISNKVSGIL
jgi:hypothetical protein